MPGTSSASTKSQDRVDPALRMRGKISKTCVNLQYLHELRRDIPGVFVVSVEQLESDLTSDLASALLSDRIRSRARIPLSTESSWKL